MFLHYNHSSLKEEEFFGLGEKIEMETGKVDGWETHQAHPYRPQKICKKILLGTDVVE